ncbi:partial Serine/threonine-protein kinase PknB, partial [Anaerolineae bacterium]
RIIAHAARGLHALHQKGVYHRDITPGNIMVSGSDSRAVVMDLGLARLWNSDLSLGTRSLMVLGTLRYMPPEQIGRGAHDVKEPADIYALGATLFELATLSPFCTADSYIKLTTKVLIDEQVDARVTNPNIPGSLANIITVATAKVADQRYATAAEMADQLEAFGRGEAIPARKVVHVLPSGTMAEITAEEYRVIADAIGNAKDDDAAYLARRKYSGSRFATKLTRAVDMRVKALREAKQLRRPLRALAGARTTRAAERALKSAKGSFDPDLKTKAFAFAESYLSRRVELTNTIGARLRLVIAGSFEMGDDEFRDNPRHKVEISRVFYLGVCAVTNQQWRQFKAGHDSGEIQGHTLDGDNQPVVAISWPDAEAFCKWLSEREGRTYRLPTEAEWEYVARAGRLNIDSKFPWSNGPKRNPGQAKWPPSGRAGNYADLTAFRELRRGKPQGYDYDDGFPVSSPVGSFDPNPWGLFDMSGNTWDWCRDWYDPFACSESARDPLGPDDYTIGMYKVARGGSFKNNDRKGLMTASRSHFDHSNRLDNCGLRLVLET